MKSNINKLQINSNKFNHVNKNILIISDIHLTNKKGMRNLKKIKDDLCDEFNNIDYILIVGDIIDNGNDLFIEENRIKFKYYLDNFICRKRTIIVLGNHDLINTNSVILFKEMFKDIKNVSILDNGEIIKEDIFSFMGIVPDREYYYDYKEDIGKYEKFVLSKCKNKFDKKSFNIVLTHSPISILEYSKINNKCVIDNTDLVVSGHMHNGLVPIFLQKFLKGRGFVGPFKKLFINYCYGIYKVANTTFIINGAINTYVKNKVINSLFSAKATLIKISSN